jgi:uncharacterized protein YecE (DUF72 family)
MLHELRRAHRRCGAAVSDRAIQIGTVGFPVAGKTLFPHVDWVEIADTRHSLPKVQTAKRWRDEAPGRVVFSLQLPKYLFETPPPGAPLAGEPGSYGGFKPTTENRQLFENALRVADALRSEVLVLATGPALTPSKRHRDALGEFLDGVSREGRTLVWQPAGPWEPHQAELTAETLDMVLAVDPLRDPPPPGALAYFRLGPFTAMASRVGTYDLERLIEAAAPYERAVIVFETPRALDDVRNLKRVLADTPD